MAHFQVTATPEPSDELEYAFVGDGVVTVRVGNRLSLFFSDPVQLEALGTVCLEAARDLGFALEAKEQNRALTEWLDPKSSAA